MSLKQHERGIHALLSGADGARVTEVRFYVGTLPYRSNKLSGNSRFHASCA
jgi:hypothetical protein